MKNIENLYEIVKNNNFNINIIKKVPKTFLIFRLAANLSQRELANKLKVSQGSIWAIEKGKRNPSEKVLNKFSDLLANKPQVTLEELKERLKTISEKGKFKGEFAKMMSQRASKERSLKGELMKSPTNQELSLIEKFKRENIPFKFKAVVTTKKRKFVIDFAFPTDKNPKLLLEVKNSQKSFRKRSEAIQLAYKAIKVKKKNKKVKLIALLEGSWSEEALLIVREDFDKVFVNQEDLIDFLKSAL